MTKKITFDTFFQQATGFDDGPYCYQRKLAEEDSFPTLLDIPTGLGKTAAVILAWLYRHRVHPDETIRESTPRRLVYCLPMRTLVDQTERVACNWVDNLSKNHDQFRSNPISVHVLMGGAETADWDAFPERDAILIGTQDMLLSRALNRGYGMSRYRWPMTFSLLNNDCLWVMDETQLMGVGLTTSAQLQGFRAKLNTYGVTQSLWMSATLDDEVLSTVDHGRPDEGWRKLPLTDDLELPRVKRLFEAKKDSRRSSVVLSTESSKDKYPAEVADAILKEHVPGTLTLAVVNRVVRAQEIFRLIQNQCEKDDHSPEAFLIHSRFRSAERASIQKDALDEESISPDGPGRIVIATQAIEAGVDISATTLFTELAPWSSMVQRFGRCNRRGECDIDGHAEARVFWIDCDTSDAKQSKVLALPYSADELNATRDHLSILNDVGPQSLSAVEHSQERPVVHTIRRKDLLELWDTSPDLAGNDLDVSRYIRDTDDTDVQVYWREWDINEANGRPPDPRDNEGQLVFPAPGREELCAIPVGGAKDFLGKLKDTAAWQWNPVDGEWERVHRHRVRPGMVLLLHINAGGYDPMIGWTGNSKHRPGIITLSADIKNESDSDDADDSGKKPLLLTSHLQKVTCEATVLKEDLHGTLNGVPWKSIITAARWHDVGKSHPAVQTAMQDHASIRELDPGQEQVWAKSGASGIQQYRVIETDAKGNPRPVSRRGFRHELASALVWLASSDGQTAADLIAFLIAAHHGKVRGSIRSLPKEKSPPDPRLKFARGLWEGDVIVAVDLGDGEMTPEVTVNLSLMELGEDENGRPSWLARVLKLRDEYGPFRLAYLEMLVRIADWRGSNEGGTSDV